MSLRKYLLAFIMLSGCSSAHQLKDMGSTTEKFDKQGHRGCRGLMPENTITAMISALDLGVTTLEMDVVVTKDNKLVLSHEPFFNHEITTTAAGKYVTEPEEKSLNIYRMDYVEVKNYDVGLKPHPRFPKQQKIKAVKPLLTDVIDTVERHTNRTRRTKPYYNIEIKTTDSTDGVYHPAPAQFADMLVVLVKTKDIADRVILQSFDIRPLQYLHEKYPDMKLSLLTEDYDKRSLSEQLKALGFTPDIYSPHYSFITEELVSECHKSNMKVIPWTVNDKSEITRLRVIGVDGIISDYPDLFEK